MSERPRLRPFHTKNGVPPLSVVSYEPSPNHSGVTVAVMVTYCGVLPIYVRGKLDIGTSLALQWELNGVEYDIGIWIDKANGAKDITEGRRIASIRVQRADSNKPRDRSETAFGFVRDLAHAIGDLIVANNDLMQLAEREELLRKIASQHDELERIHKQERAIEAALFELNAQLWELDPDDSGDPLGLLTTGDELAIAAGDER